MAVRGLSRRVQAADDLTQETYLRALGSLPRFSGKSSARTWLLSIARRVAVDDYRAARVRPRRADVEDWQDAADRAHRPGPGFDDGVALAGLLDGLAEERRTAFVLTQVFGLTYGEAAQVCRCPVGTIRSRVARPGGPGHPAACGRIREAPRPLDRLTAAGCGVAVRRSCSPRCIG